MKFIKYLASGLLSAILVFSVVGCSDKTDKPVDPTDSLSGTIDIYLPLDIREKEALEIVASEYRRLHPNVTVSVEPSSDPSGYAKAVEGIILAPNEAKGDVMQVNVVNQYYGTDKIVDFSSYLSRRNPYAENTPVWRSLLEEDAYRTEENGQTIPSLSYQSNSLLVFYNKKVFSENGWSVPSSWEELIGLLQDAKEKGYDYPLAVNYDKSGITGNNFEWLMHMYMDQYFRDMCEVAHSRESDYSYIEEIDADWTYSAEKGDIDLRSGYTYNLSRLIDAYFNGNEFNPKSARFADMMANFYQLTRYASSSYTVARARSAFHNGVLNIENGSQSKAESAVLYVARMDYIADYQTSIGGVLDFTGGTMPASALNESLGCFAMPAMTDNAGVTGGAPASDRVRTLGGPDHRPIGIIYRSREKTELVMDFLMYWLSPVGMETFYSYYTERGLVCPLTCLVKNVIISPDTDFNDMPTFVGDCDLNPYQIFGCGYTDGVFESSTGGTVRDGVSEQIRNYLTGNSSDWSAYGVAVYNKIYSGFANYAEWKRLKFASPEQASSYFSVNPIKLQQ